MIWDLKKYGDNIAMIDDAGNQVTYRELAETEGFFRSHMEERSLAFLLCAGKIGSVAGYLHMVNIGIVPVLLSHELDRELFETLYELYKPDYLWVPKEETARYPNTRTIAETYDYVLLKTLYNKEYELYSELALLLTTSGSTGSPKLVRQSYKNILANTKSIVQYLELNETERPITTLPMNYTYGLSILNSHIYVGATVLITDYGIMQKEFWSFFKREQATSFGGVPYTYEMLKKLRLFQMELPSLRTMTQAGGKLSPELHREFAEYAQKSGRKFIVMYGQTEATARMAYLPADKSLEKYGSMGIAIPGGKFKLIDVDGHEVTKPYVTGELVYTGENVTLGYAQKGADLQKGDERNGVLVTGDMAQVDAEGYYYIVGRKKRFLKIYGNRVNLDETERLIQEQFPQISCACTGVDDKMYIFVTDLSVKQELKQYLAHKTKLNTYAFCIKYIDEIPKNDSGKTLYAKLEKYYD